MEERSPLSDLALWTFLWMLGHLKNTQLSLVYTLQGAHTSIPARPREDNQRKSFCPTLPGLKWIINILAGLWSVSPGADQEMSFLSWTTRQHLSHPSRPSQPSRQGYCHVSSLPLASHHHYHHPGDPHHRYHHYPQHLRQKFHHLKEKVFVINRKRWWWRPPLSLMLMRFW